MALQTRTRIESPVRWQKAAERATAEGIQVRQLQSTGQWVATSGSDRTTAYELAVTGNVVLRGISTAVRGRFVTLSVATTPKL